MKIGYIGVQEPPRIIEVEPDCNGRYLKIFQKLVGGYIEFFEIPYGHCPALIVNEDGICACLPNRAVYANKHMEEAGFSDAFTYSHPVKAGELYSILFGPILAVSFDFDDEGNEIYRDITPEEFSLLESDFKDMTSGLREALKIKLASY